MRNYIVITLLAAAMAGETQAQALRTPAPSTTQTVKQDFALGSVELSYSRPSAKGRTVMGNLVPFGKVWRTGANQATTVAFTEDVKIGGKDVKAGKYGLLSIPEAKEWTLILTKDLNVTSPAAYNEANDVVRVKVPVTKTQQTVETFTISFANITNNSMDVQLAWENTLVALPVQADVDAKVMAQIDQVMNKDNLPYFAAAQYYFDNGKDLAKAKEWADKAVAGNPNAFWMTLLNARICAKMGDKATARAMADKTISLATQAKNDDYIKMANDLLKTL